jgi:transcriptional regulator with XRE-family HTH domain
MPNNRVVKLDKMLAHLIEQQGYTRARKIICKAVGISPSALAQYMKPEPEPADRANGAKVVRPSFDVLVALADFFAVSLDYLVFGEQPGQVQPIDYGPLGRYIDKAISDSQMRNDERTATVARIAQRLSMQMESVAQEIIKEANTKPVSGIMTCDDSLNTELCSMESYIITMDMQNDILEPGSTVPDGDDVIPGKFFNVVARNLSRGRKYRFLLPYGVRDWAPLVSAYYRLLLRQCGNDPIVLKNAQFRCTTSPLLTGCALLNLDIPEMQSMNPILYEQFRYGLNHENWLGLILPPSADCQHASVMDCSYLNNALANFHHMWDNAMPITSTNAPSTPTAPTKPHRS